MSIILRHATRQNTAETEIHRKGGRLVKQLTGLRYSKSFANGCCQKHARFLSYPIPRHAEYGKDDDGLLSHRAARNDGLMKEYCLVIVAASTDCFSHLPLDAAVEKLVDLEFANIEIFISESGDHLKPSQVASDLNHAIRVCSSTRRLNVVSYGFEIAANSPNEFEHFTACCDLAKATKVVTITVPSGELGTPFNEEVERFKMLVKIAEAHGVRVGMRSEHGRLSEDPDTVAVICDHVKGVGLSFDPSHYLYGRTTPRDTDKLFKYVQHVYLRDTTPENLQVRVGQGQVDYGRLVSQLTKANYKSLALRAHQTGWRIRSRRRNAQASPVVGKLVDLTSKFQVPIFRRGFHQHSVPTGRFFLGTVFSTNIPSRWDGFCLGNRVRFQHWDSTRWSF